MNLPGQELEASPKPHFTDSNSPVDVYKDYLKSKYLKQKVPNYGKWPDLPSEKYVNLTVTEKPKKLSRNVASNNSKALTTLMLSSTKAT